jgi:hypothetical protein
MASYAEELAQWRAQRKQTEIANRAQEIAQEHAQYARDRNTAIANNDLEEAEYNDNACESLEQEYQKIVPQQPPPVDPRLAQFGQTNQGYLNKLRARVGPERTGQFLNWIDQRLVNMGYQRNTPGYFERGRDMLELDSQRVTGVAYDSKDQALTADEAAKISGLSPQEYNRAAQVIGGQGRYSWQQKK